ncbi:hypothetical protein [Rathayibacter sp. VKM Ac-2857]|uniref:hypothetical protein n=1 Tax=Rathayibacter sp. VKM Ac-2857 TaxID=2739020 RepID=UPI0015637CC6|nr:hypothetical protein [Rathayibacter sp. VKM Ac-2857]NQX17238.1 hypothetical protein [Rathayibacter sp. VKM Ac-2857]
MEKLAPLEQLIKIRQERLNALISALDRCQADRVSFVRLYRAVNDLTDSYRTRGWDLFEADLDLLADLDCLALYDGDVIVKPAPALTGG